MTEAHSHTTVTPHRWHFRFPCHVTERHVEALVELIQKEVGPVRLQARHERGQDEDVTLDYLLREGRWARLYGFDLVVEGQLAVRVRDWPWHEVEVVWSHAAAETASRIQDQVRRWSAPLQVLCHFGILVWLPLVAASYLSWSHGQSRRAEAAHDRLAEIVAAKSKTAAWTTEQAEGALREATGLLERQLSGSWTVSAVVAFVLAPVVGLLLTRLKPVARFVDLLFLWWARLFPAVQTDFPSAAHTQWPDKARWIAVGLWIAGLVWAFT